MMAYDSQFVICVLYKGSPVREIGSTVHLPFHSEYKIRLKNKQPALRAKARVWVDGRKVSNLGDFILQAGETLDLERFLDQSMTEGNRFKFVPLSDGRVNDPTDPENGIIKVEFYRERPLWQFDIKPLITKSHPGGTNGWYNGPTYYTNCSSQGLSGGGTSSRTFSNVMTYAAEGPASIGATVEGSVSGQSFVYGSDFDTELFPVTLTLQLKGLERVSWEEELPRPRGIKRRVIRFCPHCGRRRHRQADHFCQRCGTAYRPRYESERGNISPR